MSLPRPPLQSCRHCRGKEFVCCCLPHRHHRDCHCPSHYLQRHRHSHLRQSCRCHCTLPPPPPLRTPTLKMLAPQQVAIVS